MYKKDEVLENILRVVQKPGRYIGNELGSVKKDKGSLLLRFAFCFPDVYEIAMSHLGMKILYNVLNKCEEIWCERAFAPWFDMGEQLRAKNLPLFALESRDPLADFDVLGFTLQYEMSYTNILYMLDLSSIPLLAGERSDKYPLVIGGGPCACNPEPIAAFFDLFVLGEGEEAIKELCYFLLEAKMNGFSKKKTLKLAAELKGVYVPSLYRVSYNPDGTLFELTADSGAPKTVHKRIIRNFNNSEYFDTSPVPMIEAVHDRTTIEVLRGCLRGCRFCQAGFIYRPFRTKSVDTLNAQAKEQCAATGYDEISLLSLSTGDHPQLGTLLDSLHQWTDEENINVSLPSLRADSLKDEIMRQPPGSRRSSITIAPEAGTQRLRDIINKNLTQEDILSACENAFENGYTGVKLYFMIGLPGETDEDVAGIVSLAQTIVDLFYSLAKGKKGRSVSVNISVSYFVPKPFTPFQFAAQDSVESFKRKQKLLLSMIKSRKISLDWHDAQVCFIEAVLARGDRRLAQVLRAVYREGSIFESWGEGFKYENWEKAFKRLGLDPAFYANRERSEAELLPWDMFDFGVEKGFLRSEYEKAKKALTTVDCKNGCSSCGVAKLIKGDCFADIQALFQQNG